MEPEICSVTGTEAYASFASGVGHAWFGSVHDADVLVDTAETPFEGPVCDELISASIAEGRVVVCGNSLEGVLLPPSAIGSAAAARLFALGAGLQRTELEKAADGALPEALRHVRIGGAVLPVVRPLPRPAWHAAVQHVLASVADPDDQTDFVLLGRIWILSERAMGRRPSPEDESAAAQEVFSFERDAEKVRADAAAMYASMREVPEGSRPSL